MQIEIQSMLSRLNCNAHEVDDENTNESKYVDRKFTKYEISNSHPTITFRLVEFKNKSYDFIDISYGNFIYQEQTPTDMIDILEALILGNVQESKRLFRKNTQFITTNNSNRFYPYEVT